MYYNAQLNAENICIAIGETPHKLVRKNIISIPSYDVSLLGKKYVNGEWQETEDREQEKTQLDRIEEAVSAKNADIAAAAIDEYTLQLMEGGIL